MAELIGGTTIAREVVLTSLKLGKPVVTANKALLSAHGEELFAAAKKFGTNLYYEASVAGGIPIIKSLRERVCRQPDHRTLYGIVNGTCNYILTRMKLEGAEFANVLADAQKLGYAETPPDLDIDGHDAAHKTGILASLAHGFWVSPKKIHVEGIRHITALDIKYAGELGYTIKLLGTVKKLAPGCGIQVSVYPTLIPNAHVLASVNYAFNAVFVRGDIVGELPVLRSRRGQGSHRQRGVERSGGRGAGFEICHQTPVAAVRAARIFRTGGADWRGRVTILCPAERHRQAGCAGARGHHLWRIQHRHFVRHPVGRARRLDSAVDFHATLRHQRRGQPGLEENWTPAGHKGPARHDPEWKPSPELR